MQNLPGASELLLNMCIVFIGSLTLQFFLPMIKPGGMARTLFVQAVLNIEMFLCMSFPYTQAKGFSFDLRAIPMILGPLYGGPVTSATMLTLFLTYRIFIGGPQTMKGLVIGISLVGFSLLMSRYFTDAPRAKKVVLAAAPMVLLLSGLDILLWHALEDVHGRILILVAFDFINLILLTATILGMEYVAENFKLSQEINRTEKLHVVGELAASIAHEIRNPLTVTRGFLQLAIQSHRVPPDEKDYLATAVDELDRAHGIINDYLSLARPSTDESTSIDLDELVRHVVDTLSPYAHLHNVKVSLHVSSRVCVPGDSKKLTQLFVNVIKNAVEAMPAGGLVTIRTQCSKSRGTVSIRDTGIGMSNEELKRLGNPFYSTKANGTGLGLMASYQICRSLGGKIEVSSSPGKGTEFTVYLPLTKCP
ncbi:ATP-binding protein [Alicyclobacillus sp. ALC3]|uniref:ATP-binding protein n=1 Tax=Alicyclobacillus sp. ALC3 TaxID=2796143 RepID=UPI002377EA7A|nr:ATP-binding protein [Alicyclobacillus sp. ALC3]WDL96023.1 hypothetical protein JC200_16995 [Alicyclobacillus sp. ALC3]